MKEEIEGFYALPECEEDSSLFELLRRYLDELLVEILGHDLVLLVDHDDLLALDLKGLDELRPDVARSDHRDLPGLRSPGDDLLRVGVVLAEKDVLQPGVFDLRLNRPGTGGDDQLFEVKLIILMLQQ